jgi:septal ring factor EnvC (AmiA/AmiB activator)
MKKYLLVVLSFCITTTTFSQSKKDLIEKLEKQVLELQDKYNQINTKTVILEEKLKFAEREINLLKKQIASSVNQETENTPKIIQQQPKEEPKQQSSGGGGGRCQATTKKGTRCSRSASSGNYCWQHSK